MKDVAILTKYYKNYNYGGMLQGYALHKVIIDMGFSCDIIAYDVNANANPVYPSIVQQCKQYGFKAAVEKVMEKAVGKLKYLIKDTLSERKKLFDQFQKDVDADSKLYSDETLSELNDQYYAFISGSDQVWNPNAVRLLYLQGFVQDNKKKIAYAASIGRSSFSEHEAEVLIPFIDRFDFLGIREKTGKQLLERYVHQNVSNVIDPTLLLSEEEWADVAVPRIVEGKYSLYYFFSNSYEIRKKTAEFCANHGLKMVLIPYAKQEFNFDDRKGECLRMNAVGPREFLSLIKHASFVFTDSFHGAVFSIIHNKQFVVFERNKKGHVSMNSRLYDLLDGLELSDRMIYDTESIESLEKIDYVKVQQKKINLQKVSREFLKSALKES